MATEARDLLAQVVGEKLRELRRQKGYSLELLAGLCGMSKPTLSLYETGRQVPRGDSLITLAYVLGTRVEDLLPRDYAPFVDARRMELIRSVVERDREAGTDPAAARERGKQRRSTPRRGRSSARYIHQMPHQRKRSPSRGRSERFARAS